MSADETKKTMKKKKVDDPTRKQIEENLIKMYPFELPLTNGDSLKNSVREKISPMDTDKISKYLKVRKEKLHLSLFCCCKTKNVSDEQPHETDHPSNSKIWANQPSENYLWLLDDFEIITKLGKGTFGQVFLVRHNNFKEKVALKVLLKEYYLPDKIYKVIRENKAWKLTSEHPHIISLYHFFETDTCFNFISAYAPGGNLSTLISMNGPLEEDEAKILAVQIASAIMYIHEKGIIHRDISAKNVLLDSCGDAQLTDFGLCTFDPEPKDYCGTLSYLSPEILKREPYDFYCDWWAYGILVYKILVGKTPLELYLRNVLDISNHKMLSRKVRLKVALQVEIKYPTNLSENAKYAIKDILQREPKLRLRDVDIKNHKFFRDVAWPKEA